LTTDAGIAIASDRTDRARLDQWLWFARFAKSRSLAARLCTAGAVTLNGNPVGKANQAVRVGDVVAMPQGGWQRMVRVVALGVRRGPATEARLLYAELAPATRLRDVPAGWVPLLDDGEPADAVRRPETLI
jgi:ribosome-associated heat shock protein Hsp15